MKRGAIGVAGFSHGRGANVGCCLNCYKVFFAAWRCGRPIHLAPHFEEAKKQNRNHHWEDVHPDKNHGPNHVGDNKPEQPQG
jgi:hypothetical protein